MDENNNTKLAKKDILSDDGKLTTLGAFLFIACAVSAINFACKYLTDNFIEKE